MADTLDLISLTEALEAIQQDSVTAPLDDALEAIVTGVSRQIDRDWGPMVTRSVTALLDGGGPVVMVDLYPISAVSTVYERNGTTQNTIVAETYSAPTAYDYLLEASTGRLFRRSGGYDYCWASGRRNVTVTYTAGRYANTAGVDSHVKLAAKIAVQHVWRMSKGMGSTVFGAGDAMETGWPAPFTIPRAAAALLGPRQSKGVFA